VLFRSVDAVASRPVEFSVPWIPSLGIAVTLRLDGLAALFAVLVVGVGALIMAYCPRYLHGDHHVRTYMLLTLFAGAMLGLVLAADLVLLFVFWELTAISSFFLIGGTGPHSAAPAKRALLVTAGGGVGLLVAVVLIIVATGTSDLDTIVAHPELISDSGFAVPVAVLVALAAFTKSAQLPFHSWLPGAMVAITPVSAYLHAATMVKAGIYLLMRFSPVFADAAAWHGSLTAVGLSTAVVAAARDCRARGGPRGVRPAPASLTARAAASLAGVPPTMGFVSKETIFQGLAEADCAPWAGGVSAGLGVAASALTFAYAIRIFRG